MSTTDLAAQAERLRSLHVPGEPVVLVNAWDVTSARVFQDAGFPAIATSSSAVANSLGHEDGEETPSDEMFAAVERISGAVAVPVTADIERGYRLEPEVIVERLLAAGAVGCNLEDSDPRSGELVDSGAQAEWLGRVRAAADAAGVPIVLNARVDVHLREWGEPHERMDEAVERANAYLSTGATSVYPIGIKSLSDIEEFVERANGPANIVSRPRGPSMAEMASAGVARISFGGGLHQLMQYVLGQTASKIREGADPYEV